MTEDMVKKARRLRNEKSPLGVPGSKKASFTLPEHVEKDVLEFYEALMLAESVLVKMFIYLFDSLEKVNKKNRNTSFYAISKKRTNFLNRNIRITRLDLLNWLIHN